MYNVLGYRGGILKGTSLGAKFLEALDQLAKNQTVSYLTHELDEYEKNHEGQIIGRNWPSKILVNQKDDEERQKIHERRENIVKSKIPTKYVTTHEMQEQSDLMVIGIEKAFKFSEASGKLYIPRKFRPTLMNANMEEIVRIAKEAAQEHYDGQIFLFTNPIDTMTKLMHDAFEFYSGERISPNKIMGINYLDPYRLNIEANLHMRTNLNLLSRLEELKDIDISEENMFMELAYWGPHDPGKCKVIKSRSGLIYSNNDETDLQKQHKLVKLNRLIEEGIITDQTIQQWIQKVEKECDNEAKDFNTTAISTAQSFVAMLKMSAFGKSSATMSQPIQTGDSIVPEIYLGMYSPIVNGKFDLCKNPFDLAPEELKDLDQMIDEAVKDEKKRYDDQRRIIDFRGHQIQVPISLKTRYQMEAFEQLIEKDKVSAIPYDRRTLVIGTTNPDKTSSLVFLDINDPDFKDVRERRKLEVNGIPMRPYKIWEKNGELIISALHRREKNNVYLIKHNIDTAESEMICPVNEEFCSSIIDGYVPTQFGDLLSINRRGIFTIENGFVKPLEIELEAKYVGQLETRIIDENLQYVYYCDKKNVYRGIFDGQNIHIDHVYEITEIGSDNRILDFALRFEKGVEHLFALQSRTEYDGKKQKEVKKYSGIIHHYVDGANSSPCIEFELKTRQVSTGLFEYKPHCIAASERIIRGYNIVDKTEKSISSFVKGKIAHMVFDDHKGLFVNLYDKEHVENGKNAANNQIFWVKKAKQKLPVHNEYLDSLERIHSVLYVMKR